MRTSVVGRYALAVAMAILSVLARLALTPLWGLSLRYLNLPERLNPPPDKGAG